MALAAKQHVDVAAVGAVVVVVVEQPSEHHWHYYYTSPSTTSTHLASHQQVIAPHSTFLPTRGPLIWATIDTTTTLPITPPPPSELSSSYSVDDGDDDTTKTTPYFEHQLSNNNTVPPSLSLSSLSAAHTTEFGDGNTRNTSFSPPIFLMADVAAVGKEGVPPPATITSTGDNKPTTTTTTTPESQSTPSDSATSSALPPPPPSRSVESTIGEIRQRIQDLNRLTAALTEELDAVAPPPLYSALEETVKTVRTTDIRPAVEVTKRVLGDLQEGFSGLLSAAKDFDAAATTSQVKARMEKELEARKLAEEQQVLLAGGGESSSSSASSSTSSSSSSTSAAAPKSEVPSIKK